MAEKKEKQIKNPENIFENFLNEKNQFAELLSENIVDYFKEEKKPEVELIVIYLEGFTTSVKNAGLELIRQYNQSDTETLLLIDNHIENTGITKMLNSTNQLLKKKKGILGFLGKIAPILEIIKKLLTHITEKFPKFLEKLLKNILIPILEMIENIIKIVLDLFDDKSASKYLINAERNFLETHPLWRKLQFESLDTTSDK